MPVLIGVSIIMTGWLIVGLSGIGVMPPSSRRHDGDWG